MKKLGDGSRFRSLKKELAAKGAKNPSGLAAYLGRKKYGNDRFAELSRRGREKASKRRVKGFRIKV